MIEQTPSHFWYRLKEETGDGQVVRYESPAHQLYIKSQNEIRKEAEKQEDQKTLKEDEQRSR